jgi:hypothetical protein
VIARLRFRWQRWRNRRYVIAQFGYSLDPDTLKRIKAISDEETARQWWELNGPDRGRRIVRSARRSPQAP